MAFIKKDEYGNLTVGTFSKLVALGLILVIALILFFTSFRTIDAGERGVLLNWGQASDEILEPGLHWKIPIQQKIVKIDVQTQKVEVDANSASKDLQSVSAKVVLNYYANPGFVNVLYKEIGKDYQERIIQPAIQESVKAATAQFTAEELITKRSDVNGLVRKSLEERLAKSNIVLSDLSIVNFSFSKGFDEAIEAKQTAEQNAKKAKNDLERIKTEAQQTIEKAKADAESIKIQGDALKNNPELVNLKAVEKWNGQLPTYVLGDSVPFLQITK